MDFGSCLVLHCVVCCGLFRSCFQGYIVFVAFQDLRPLYAGRCEYYSNAAPLDHDVSRAQQGYSTRVPPWDVFCCLGFDKGGLEYSSGSLQPLTLLTMFMLEVRCRTLLKVRMYYHQKKYTYWTYGLLLTTLMIVYKIRSHTYTHSHGDVTAINPMVPSISPAASHTEMGQWLADDCHMSASVPFSQVNCHTGRGSCNLRVKSNTCYCCELYNCGKWVSRARIARSVLPADPQSGSLFI